MRSSSGKLTRGKRRKISSFGAIGAGFWRKNGRSIPGAIGLRYSGVGGSYIDVAQERLRGKLHELASGDLSRPIVAVGWNSDRFDGWNLALKLVALGYTQVYWYRAGREAWLPEAELDVQPW